MAQARFNVDIRDFMAAGPAPPGSIILLGSSIMRLWPTWMIERSLQPYPVLNLAFGGSQTHDMVAHSEPLCSLMTASSPKCVAFYCGSNDISFRSSAESAYERACTFFERWKSTDGSKGVPLVIVGALISPEKRHQSAEVVVAYNRLLSAYCDTDPLLHFADPNPVVTETPSMLQANFDWDGVHLTEAGYFAWTKVLSSVILKAISEAS